MTSVAYAALWIFIFAVPWERLVVLPGLSIVTRVTGALALGLALLAIVISGRARRWRVFHVAALLFVVWTGIGVWMRQGGHISLKFYTFVQLFLVVWMIWELASTPGRQRGLLAAYVFGAAVPAVATILLFLSHGSELRRFSAGGADANSLAMTLALALPIAWYLSLTQRRVLSRWLFRGYLPLGLIATALSASRGGMLAWLVAMLIIPLTTGLSPKKLAAAIGLLALSAILVVAYIPDQVVERLGTTGSQLENLDLNGRFKIWVAGAHAFAQRPFMGYGVGGFKEAITPELGSLALVAHNSFLSILVEEGLVGLLLFMTMLLSVYTSVLHLPRLERRFGLVLLATLGITMLPLTWEDKKPVWFVMAAVIGMSTLRISRPVEAVGQPASGRALEVPVAAGSMRRVASLRQRIGGDATE
jgi:O-antigen ligase